MIVHIWNFVYQMSANGSKMSTKMTRDIVYNYFCWHNALFSLSSKIMNFIYFSFISQYESFNILKISI